MREDCLFCNIANHKKEALVWENQIAAAFKDIHPKAPTHLLVVPKAHVENLDELKDSTLAAELISAVQEVADLAGLADGYRVVVNVKDAGGQVVDHLHIHILGGKKLDESTMHNPQF